MVGKVKSIKNDMKSSLILENYEYVAYKDCGMYYNFNLPPSLEIMKFEEHNGHKKF